MAAALPTEENRPAEMSADEEFEALITSFLVNSDTTNNSESNQENGSLKEEEEINASPPSVESLASSDSVITALDSLRGIQVAEPSPIIKQLYEQIVDNLTASERYEMIATLHQYYTGKLTMPDDPFPPNEYVKSAWNTYLVLNAMNIKKLIEDYKKEKSASNK